MCFANLHVSDQLEPLVKVLEGIREAGTRVFVCGNGGSCANAAHLVLHLRDAGIKAHDLMADAPWLTAVANDHGYQQIFAWTLHSLGAGPDDLLIVVSGSGNSKNVIEALEYAAANNIPRWGLLGMGGGTALSFCNGAVVVASDSYAVIEDIHSIAIHALHKALTKS